MSYSYETLFSKLLEHLHSAFLRVSKRRTRFCKNGIQSVHNKKRVLCVFCTVRGPYRHVAIRDWCTFFLNQKKKNNKIRNFSDADALILPLRCSYSSAVFFLPLYYMQLYTQTDVDINTCLLERNKIFANLKFLHDLCPVRPYHKTSLLFGNVKSNLARL